MIHDNNRHASKVLVVTSNDGETVTIELDCEKCGRFKFTIPALHLTTIKEVCDNVAKQLGVVLTEQIVKNITDTLNVDDVDTAREVFENTDINDWERAATHEPNLAKPVSPWESDES